MSQMMNTDMPLELDFSDTNITFPDDWRGNKKSRSKKNHAVLSLLLANSSVSAVNLEILTRRKNTRKQFLKDNRGLSSEQIDAYLHLCLIANGNGEILRFSHFDFVNNDICCDRSVYNILKTLEEYGLIKVSGNRYSHYCHISLLNYKSKKGQRFLNLNRTFFHAGNKDYDNFKSLSAGAKSLLLYILFSSDFEPDSKHDVYEVNVYQIAKHMGVGRNTVISYIERVNETFGQILITHGDCGQLSEHDALSLSDKRVKYRSLTLPLSAVEFTQVSNASLGFWRDFETFLSRHNISIRVGIPRILYDISTHGSDEERLQNVRDLLFNTFYHLAMKGMALFDIYKVFMRVVREHGYIDELTPKCMYRMLYAN